MVQGSWVGGPLPVSLSFFLSVLIYECISCPGRGKRISPTLLWYLYCLLFSLPYSFFLVSLSLVIILVPTISQPVYSYFIWGGEILGSIVGESWGPALVLFLFFMWMYLECAQSRLSSHLWWYRLPGFSSASGSLSSCLTGSTLGDCLPFPCWK